MLFRPQELFMVANQITKGAVALFPFDTLLGLTSIISQEHCAKIHAIKQRANQPFIVILPNQAELEQWVQPLTAKQQHIIATYWPGPITFLFNKQPHVPDYITAGKQTIGIRICDYLPVNLLMQKVQQPLLSTSANLHQEPVAKTIADCSKPILNQVDITFSGCGAYYDQPSTIVDLTTTQPKLIREGVVDFEY